MEYGLVALWLVAFLLFGAVALSLSTWLFRDRAAGPLAFPVALSVLAVVGHLVGHLAFGWPAVVAGLSVLAGVSIALGGRVDPDWRSYGEGAAVFALGFGLVVGIRSIDPAAAPLPLSIGEKMLDFGLLAVLERTGRLPPEDVWFAGEAVRYHYGGHLTAALVATLLGTPARYAYNLALSGFYATLVTAAYGLAGAVAADRGAPRRPAAALGAFFVGLAANLSVAVRALGWLLPDGPARWIVGAAGLDAAVAEWTPADFEYFGPSRVLPVDPTEADPFMAATEFPLFAWVNGDLHAHMMSQPFVLLVAALLLAYWRVPGEPRRRAALLFGAVPPAVGLVGAVNVWSFPVVVGLVALAVLFAPGAPTGVLGERLGDRFTPDGPAGREDHPLVVEGRRLAVAAAATLSVLVLAVLWTAPFWAFVAAGGPGWEPAYWPHWSPLGALVLVHGAFLLAVGPPLAARAGVEADAPLIFGGVVVAGLAASVTLGAPALGLFLPLVAVGWWLLRRAEDVGFAALLVVAGAGVVLLVELLTLEGERFNVIFKPYADVWLLFSIAAGALLARLADGWPAGRLGVDRRRLRLAGRVLAALLVVTTGLYAVLLLPDYAGGKHPRWEPEEPTLDATAYLESEFPREAPAIRWLANRSGRPTVVTAAPGGYRWQPSEGRGSSAPASLTGLPTVLGWFHERQYRGGPAYEARLADVETIYAGAPGEQSRLLRKHDVEYVYVGPAERNRYGEVTVGAVPGVAVAKEWEAVTVYRVDREALGE